MNRHVKFVLVMATVATFAVAVGAIAWRVHLVGTLGLDLRPRPLAPAILLATPLFLAIALGVTARRLAAFKPGISGDNPRHIQATLLILFPFVALCEGWMGFLYVETQLPGSDAFLRFAIVFLGVMMAVAGNFYAKLSPPSVEGLDRAGWTRAALRTGWGSVIVGAALVICALTLPLKVLFAVCLGAAVVLIGLAVVQRRALRRS